MWDHVKIYIFLEFFILKLPVDYWSITIQSGVLQIRHFSSLPHTTHQIKPFMYAAKVQRSIGFQIVHLSDRKISYA